MTLPPTSVHDAIVWCGDTPVVLRSLDDRCKRHKRASRAWSLECTLTSQPQRRIESEPRGPSQLRGVRGVARIASAPITNRHDSSWFESCRSYFALFWSFWLAISEIGCTYFWSPAYISETKTHAAVVSYNRLLRRRKKNGFVGCERESDFPADVEVPGGLPAVLFLVGKDRSKREIKRKCP